MVTCNQHGEREATYICRHLAGGSRLGFNCGYGEDEASWWPSAWCDACEAMLQAAGGEWDAQTEERAGVTLVCDACYEQIRARNWPMNSAAAFESLASEATTYLEERQTRLQREFGLGEFERYDWDQEQGLLQFSSGGQVRLVATIDFVGSISTVSDTWLWAWANASLHPNVRLACEKVRKYGVEHKYLKLAAAHWDAAEPDGWEMTAVAAYLLRAQGAYRSPDDRGFIFLLLRDLAPLVS